jgi:hypothetical protein
MKFFNKLLFFIFILQTSQTSFAQSKNLGLGVILFSPTGISGNYKLSQNKSIDAAAAWSLNDSDQNLYLHSTYLWHKPGAIKIEKFKANAYYGAGARLISWDNPPSKSRDSEIRLGARGVLGANYLFQEPAIETFAELSMTVELIPDTDVDLDLGLGVRIYF